MILKIIDFFIGKTLLNVNYIPENEFKKVSFLRILTGLIIFFRFYEIFISYFLIDGFNRISLVFLVTLFAILLFVIGCLTPIINIFLIIVLPILDSVLSTKTLGTTILINLLVVLLLTNSGRYFSIDNLILKKENFFSKLLFKSYTFIGIPNKVGIQRAYFLAFILYAVSSLFALLLHIQDFYWVGGVTIKSILSNSFLCKYALIFRNLESLWPNLFDIVSIVVIVLQSIFQILMIPLVFFKAGGKYVKIWGFIFFTISLLLLSLSYLPHLELILWIIIFCPVQSSQVLITQKIHKLLGVSEASFNNKEKSENFLPAVNIKNDTYFVKFIYSFYFVCIALFIVVNNSKYYRIFGDGGRAVLFKESSTLFCKNIGIEAPQVFNYYDLSMGDNFMTIKKLKNNKWELIPYTGVNGERLNYLNFDVLLFTNHNSDLLYFGNSLVYRRMLISEVNNIEEFHNKGYGKQHMEFMLQYDYIKTKEIGNVMYKVEVFTSNSSKVKLFEFDSTRHNLKKRFEKIIVYNGQTYK